METKKKFKSKSKKNNNEKDLAMEKITIESNEEYNNKVEKELEKISKIDDNVIEDKSINEVNDEEYVEIVRRPRKKRKNKKEKKEKKETNLLYKLFLHKWFKYDHFLAGDWIDYILIILFVFLLRTFVVTPAIVDGASMNNTLNDGQLVLINKFVYDFNDVERFDIVVLDNKEDNDRIIKRIIGLPNESIVYKNNKLYINGKLMNYEFKHAITNDFSYVTKDDEYFVLGDNRIVSKDSRRLGAFSKKDIIGRVKIRLFPFDVFGIIE